MQRLLLLLAALAAAHDGAADDNAVSVTPFGGYRFGGELDVRERPASLKLDDGASIGLLVNVVKDAQTTWEVLYSRQRSEAVLDDPAGGTGPIDTDIHVLQLGGTYHGEGEFAEPYVAMTLGGAHVRASGGESDTFWSGSIGVGIDVMPARRFGLRLEVRAYATLTDSSTELFCRTGVDPNVCAIRIESEFLSQVEGFAGFTFRF